MVRARREEGGRGARSEGGFALLAVLVTATIALILMAAAVPTWRHVMKDDREQELLFRGFQIADAVERYQKKNGNAPPPSLEILVQGKYLRKLYKDPMVSGGQWRLLHRGEVIPFSPSAEPPTTLPSPSPTPSLGAAPGTTVGLIIGVASRSTEKSLRLFNGRQRYSEWVFTAGGPRMIGRQPLPLPRVQPSPESPRPGPS
jgi:type II secretory pathway pseudopilin PulG